MVWGSTKERAKLFPTKTFDSYVSLRCVGRVFATWRNSCVSPCFTSCPRLGLKHRLRCYKIGGTMGFVREVSKDETTAQQPTSSECVCVCVCPPLDKGFSTTTFHRQGGQACHIQPGPTKLGCDRGSTKGRFGVYLPHNFCTSCSPHSSACCFMVLHVFHPTTGLSRL